MLFKAFNIFKQMPYTPAWQQLARNWETVWMMFGDFLEIVLTICGTFWKNIGDTLDAHMQVLVNFVWFVFDF